MPPYSLRRLIWGGPLSTLVAILAILTYYGVTHALGEQYLLPLEMDGSDLFPMPSWTPALLTLTAGVLAATFFGLLLRFTHRPGTIFLSVCWSALLLSFGGPFNLPSIPMQTKILLSGMHVIAGVFITVGILLTSHKEVKNR